MGAFGEQVGLALGELSDMNRLAREEPLEHALIMYCRMTRAPAVLPDTIEAGDAWGANCGPMSLAAVLGLSSVEAARKLVQPFRGFMTPTNMISALQAAGSGLVKSYRYVRDPGTDPWPKLGLVRIQWEGSWLGEGVDPRAAYRYTHWVGVRRGPVPAEDDVRLGHIADDDVLIYDCTPNRWVPLAQWSAWCPTLWPKRATGWSPVTRIDVSPRTACG